MEAEPDFIIRPATQQDVPGINAILTYYALNTVMTFATSAQPDSVMAAKLDSITLENHLPFFVATTRPTSSTSAARDSKKDISHEVIGICYISPYRAERLAYRHTGEISLFVHHEHHGRGIGSALLRTVLSVTRKTRIRELLAVMAVDETGKGKGMALRDYYKNWRFREVGTLEKVGFKFERW
jgi:phosphinothricin acetyltransferase